MADTAKQESKRARAISAWESAVARTMNPHLTDAQADELWGAVLANREKPDVDTFRESIADLLDGAPTPIRHAAETLIVNLTEVLAIKE